MNPFNQMRMLLVDDQHSFQVMMKSMLINMGITHITFADTPEEARRRCSKATVYIYWIIIRPKRNGCNSH